MKKAFILGNPRSGTSLLRLMLNAHSNIVAPPESGFLHWWKNKYSNWTVSDATNRDRVSDFVSDLLTSKKIEGWKLDRAALERNIIDSVPRDYAELTSLIYITYAGGKNVSLIVDKNNYYINHLSEIAPIWNDAGYIHIVRDGRDVACSYLDLATLQTHSSYKPQLVQDISKIAHEWSENNLMIRNFLARLKPGTNFITIRYEDLLTSPERTLTDILNTFSLSFQTQMLEFYKFNDEPTSTLDWKKKTLGALDNSSMNRFSTDLGKNEILQFESIASEALEMFGYSVSSTGTN